MIKKLILILFYLSCFFLLAGIVYRISIQVPPMTADKYFVLYRILSAGLGILVASVTIGVFVLLEYVETYFRFLEDFIDWRAVEKRKREIKREREEKKAQKKR